MLQGVDDDVVGLDRIGDGGDGAVRGGDILRQVVDHPVRDIFDAVEAEQIERVFGFGQARTFPRARRLAGEFGDGFDRALDGVGLVVELVHRALDKAMPHEFKAGLQRGRSDARVGIADIGIERQRDRNVALGECLELSPEAGTHAVFVPRPVRYVGQQRLPHRRRQHRPWHRVLDSPFLDIEDDPDRELLAARKP